MPSTPSLAPLLSTDRIHVQMEVSEKVRLIEQMVALVSSAPSVRDAEKLAADVLAREAQMSTGVGEGVALPHARSSSVTETVAAFATLAHPVEYAALDGQPVQLVLLLAGPESERSAHVRLLGRVSRLMSDSAFRARLLAASSPSRILDEIEQAESALI